MGGCVPFKLCSGCVCYHVWSVCSARHSVYAVMSEAVLAQVYGVLSPDQSALDVLLFLPRPLQVCCASTGC